MKPAKILFFVSGPSPSAKDFEVAEKLSAQVVFRNALAVPSESHSLELCDGVAGDVPAIYAEAYPKASEAIKKRREEHKALSEKVGDSTAPVNTETKTDGTNPPPAWKPNGDA